MFKMCHWKQTDIGYTIIKTQQNNLKKMNKNFLFSIVILLMSGITASFACTSAIISGKATPDGRPLLWKHRDTGTPQNAIMFFAAHKYDYIGLINANDTNGEQIWIGQNSAGFAIMNTASYNLIEKDTIDKVDMEGYLMHTALKYCKTLSDFENLLDTMQKPMGVEANFGLIDAEGGAAYYETDNFKYTKIDVNNPVIAPFGYVVRTNYSFSGKADDGYGYIRYNAAKQLIDKAMAENNLTPLTIQQQISRSLTHAHTKQELKQQAGWDNSTSKYVFFEDYIPRYTSSASIIIQGVKPGEDKNLITCWTTLGFPLTSVMVPLWLAAGSEIPDMFTLNNKNVAPLCDNVLKLKRKVFPITRGSGKRYMNINALYNQKGNGIVQLLQTVETEIYNQTKLKIDKWRKTTPNKKEMLELYNSSQKQIEEAFRKNFDLEMK